MKPFTIGSFTKYHLFLYFIIGTFALHVNAADITPEEALQIANTFIQKDKTAQANIRKAPAGTKVSPSIAHRMPSRVATNKDNVYIVNLGNDQGFVVVSGEDGATAEILGYCDHGSFNYEDAPVQFLDLLNEYSAGIDSLRKDPSLASPQMPARVQISYPSYIGDIVVGPLLTTLWSQNAPYNIQCPSNENGHCYTGCVPTAVAQVMNYWKWPKMSKDSVYGLRPDGTHGMIDFSGHVYDWNHMLDYYGWSIATDSLISYNNTQANAVAKLMADIGTAMRTVYCTETGSPTFWEYGALVQNFGYQPGIGVVHGDVAANVKSALIEELDEKRPVLYAGNPVEEGASGHALVCDGYTKNNYFHFNFGWGGQTDGFYKLSAIPTFIYNVDIWTNVRPYDAIEKEIDGIKYGLLPNGTADIVEYMGGGIGVQNGEMVIPDSVTDEDTGLRYAVTHIYKQAFFRKGDFTKMVMGDNIESIDRFSFVYTNIDTLVLSDKMEVVPEEAFQVTNVKHLTIGANIKQIGARAFYACPIKDIVCKSPRVELERECFVNARLNRGDWENCIVKIGKRAFAGAKLDKDTYFENLEVLGDSAISGVMWGSSGVLDFTIGPKVREIAPSAFDGFDGGWNIPMLRVHNDNPYFTSDQEPIIYNKDTTTMHLVLKRADFLNMTKVLKMEPGCMRGAISSMTIPPTVVDMEGAFKDCMPPKYTTTIICQHMVPPAISDATFPDALFTSEEANLYLRVPEGTEALYAEAPGWRKFGSYHIETMYEEDFVPMPQQDLQYQMKIHGDSIHVAAPIADISSMRMTEENGEATVTLKVNGRVDLKTPVSNIDSIIFVPGFVYEGAEIFDLNDSTLTVNAQKCSISFDPTTIDGDVQVCVRNSVLLPRPMEGVTGGIGIDISMLNDSGRVHELSGVATITIPFSVPANESVGAAYFNEQTGEWEPVYMEYDRNAGVATILTDHLSHYAFVSVMNENTKNEIFEAIKGEIPILHAWDEATKKLLDILASDDPEIEQKFQFKNEMSLWQSIGLDGFYNGAIAIADPLFNFKPKALDDAVTLMGHIGTALTVLDVIRADLHGDQIAVASGTLKVIMARTGGVAATAIGTPIMAASMCMVAFIGVALDKFGTYIQDIKMDYFRRAYRYYYSLEGYDANRALTKFKYDAQGKEKPHAYYRTAKDWYDYFYPVFTRTDMDADQLMRYIEHSVRMYCDQYWEENFEVQDYCMMIAQQSGWNRPAQELTDTQEQQISDELFADLMNGELVSVFTALRRKQIVQAHNSAISKINNMAKMMNKKVGFLIVDSSVKEDQPSSFAGWSIGFPVLAENVADPDKWRKTIGNDGKVALGWFTTYALVRNLVPFKITLFNRAGEAVKDFEFELDGEAEKKTINIDLATEGIKVVNKHLDDLHLTYDPVAVDFICAGIDENDQYNAHITDELVYMDENTNFYKDQTRWCTEVERFFNRHNFITTDSTGNFTIGDDIAGMFVGDSATGTFVINTDYKFFIQTAQQYLNVWNNEKSTFFDRIKILLNGSCKHQIACTYKIKRRQAGDHDEYDITYTGQGAFDMTARHINYFGKSMDWYDIAVTNQGPPLFMNEIGIGTSSVGGEVTLEYKTTLK